MRKRDDDLPDSRRLIEVRDLVKSYGAVRALHGVSFEVDEGEILGFLGPNGAGKSTTLRILSGFLPGDAGTVTVNGFDVSRDSLRVRESIGYLPEGVPLYPDMRVVEYLRFRARLKRVPLRERRAQIDKALEATRTSDVRKRMIHTLSRGYRQRVGLADALLGEPPVLILDEPTVGLDPEQVRQFRALLRDVGRDRTVILSTHILSEVELVCSSVVIIAAGRIVARDTARAIRESGHGRVSVVAEIAGPEDLVLPALRALPGAVEVDFESVDGREESAFRRYRVSAWANELTAEGVYDLARERNWQLRHLELEARSLEEVFLDIVGSRS